MKVPFNRSSLAGAETGYIAEAMQSGQIGGDQQFGRRCQTLLARRIGCLRALLTTSCTHALEMCALLLDFQPGDEVIVPSFTFVSTVNAFVLRGAIPVFADVRSDTLNIDERQIEGLITSRTRAIVVVHYAGVACDMDAINAIASRYGIPVIEDNAHGLFGGYKNKPLGSIGVLATQSFHETKNFTCGEGGALIINDERYLQRAEIIREKGTNRARFFRGEVDKYTWVDVGSSYVMSDVLAAFLLAQIEQEHVIQGKRQAIWERYNAALSGWATANGIRCPTVPRDCQQAFHMYYLVMPNLYVRTNFIEAMKAIGVSPVFHYQPLHLSEMGLRFGGRVGMCPVTEEAGDCLVRLPFFTDMSLEQQSFVLDAVTSHRT